MRYKKFFLLLSILSLLCGNTYALDDLLCKYTNKNTVLLNSNDWELYFGPQDENSPTTPKQLLSANYKMIKAAVPGNVEIDLQKAGLIEDPQIAKNIYNLRPYEYYQWWYHRKFNKPTVKKGETVELCFDGIDCIADIWLNGEKIASVDNMLVEHHYDVTDLLSEEGNDLYVCIKSTELELRKVFRDNFGVRSSLRGPLASYLRKAPHMFGWDIMPRLLSAGLWKDVKLEIIPSTHFCGIYWRTQHVSSAQKNGKGNAFVLMDWQFMTDTANVDNWFLDVELSRNGVVAYNACTPLLTTCGTEKLPLKNVDLWWPRGHGEAALYDARVRILDQNKKTIAENSQKLGIRTVKLIKDQLNTKDHKGQFCFVVNNESIFMKGTNWVPMDALHSRDKARIPSAMDMIVDLNCNMIRCWGGNVYEDDLFFDLCDKYGVLVWQDFALACSVYPQTKEFKQKIREEAIKVILRLRNHASMALWSGGNETDISFRWGHTGFINPNVDVITRKVFPMAIREYDNYREYLPSSPYVTDEAFKVNNEIEKTILSEAHLWGTKLNFYKDPFYVNSAVLFPSEIGYGGCTNVESLKRMMGKEFLYPWKEKPVGGNFIWNDVWQCKACVFHPNSTRNRDSNDSFIRHIKTVFGEVPLNVDDFVLSSQIIQSEALKYFMELWRMRKGERTGMLWWNLRDGWPLLSSGIVDYYNGKKLAYTTIKHVQTDVCIMVGDASCTKHPVVGVNDTRMDKKVKLKISDADSKKVLMEKEVIIPANGRLDIGSLPQVSEHQLWLINYEVDGKKFKNHYLSYAPPLNLSDYKRWLKFIKD